MLEGHATIFFYHFSTKNIISPKKMFVSLAGGKLQIFFHHFGTENTISPKKILIYGGGG